MVLEDPNGKPKEFTVTFRKLDLPELTGEDSFIVSNQDHFNAVVKIARSYLDLTNNSTDDPIKKLTQIGERINKDYQFLDQGGGCNTIAGQIDRPSINNRDCKLPTFLLGLTQSALLGDKNCEILYLSSNPAHPYVRVNIGGKYIYGHYTKPNPKGLDISQFAVLNDEEAEQLENFRDRGRVNKFQLTLEGMQLMDELFIDS